MAQVIHQYSTAVVSAERMHPLCSSRRGVRLAGELHARPGVTTMPDGTGVKNHNSRGHTKSAVAIVQAAGRQVGRRLQRHLRRRQSAGVPGAAEQGRRRDGRPREAGGAAAPHAGRHVGVQCDGHPVNGHSCVPAGACAPHACAPLPRAHPACSSSWKRASASRVSVAVAVSQHDRRVRCCRC